MIAEHELGEIESASVRSLRSHCEALGLSLELTIRGSTGDVLKDEEHALLTEWVKRQLDSMGWTTEAEASFNIWGERGRMDLLAWNSAAGTVLVDEQKTDISDVQDLIGTLGVKERLARPVARERGWDPASVAVLLVVSKTHRNIRILQRFSALFEQFNLRGADAVRWLRQPSGPAHLLLLVPPEAVGRRQWRNGRRRVRRPRRAPRQGRLTSSGASGPPRWRAVPPRGAVTVVPRDARLVDPASSGVYVAEADRTGGSRAAVSPRATPGSHRSPADGAGSLPATQTRTQEERAAARSR